MKSRVRARFQILQFMGVTMPTFKATTSIGVLCRASVSFTPEFSGTPREETVYLSPTQEILDSEDEKLQRIPRVSVASRIMDRGEGWEAIRPGPDLAFRWTSPSGATLLAVPGPFKYYNLTVQFPADEKCPYMIALARLEVQWQEETVPAA